MKMQLNSRSEKSNMARIFSSLTVSQIIILLIFIVRPSSSEGMIRRTKNGSSLIKGRHSLLEKDVNPDSQVYVRSPSSGVEFEISWINVKDEEEVVDNNNADMTTESQYQDSMASNDFNSDGSWSIRTAWFEMLLIGEPQLDSQKIQIWEELTAAHIQTALMTDFNNKVSSSSVKYISQKGATRQSQPTALSTVSTDDTVLTDDFSNRHLKETPSSNRDNTDALVTFGLTFRVKSDISSGEVEISVMKYFGKESRRMLYVSKLQEYGFDDLEDVNIVIEKVEISPSVAEVVGMTQSRNEDKTENTQALTIGIVVLCFFGCMIISSFVIQWRKAKIRENEQSMTKSVQSETMINIRVSDDDISSLGCPSELFGNNEPPRRENRSTLCIGSLDRTNEISVESGTPHLLRTIDSNSNDTFYTNDSHIEVEVTNKFQGVQFSCLTGIGLIVDQVLAHSPLYGQIEKGDILINLGEREAVEFTPETMMKFIASINQDENLKLKFQKFRNSI